MSHILLTLIEPDVDATIASIDGIRVFDLVTRRLRRWTQVIVFCPIVPQFIVLQSRHAPVFSSAPISSDRLKSFHAFVDDVSLICKPERVRGFQFD